MDKLYIAINGDDVGKGIGNAIANDNHEELQNLSNSINESHGSLEKWVQENGGEILTSTGDETLASISPELASQLEEVKSQYQEQSGNSLTIGIGSSMSEAFKALISSIVARSGNSSSFLAS